MTNPASVTALRAREQRMMPWLAPLLAVVTASGFATYFVPKFDEWVQWGYLLHTSTGFILSALLIVYAYIHFRRTIVVRRPIQLLLGLLSVSILIALIATGVHIGILGQYESLRWIFTLHIVIAFVFIFSMAAHIIGYRWYAIGKKISVTAGYWSATLKYSTLRNSIYSLLVSIIVVGLFDFVYLSHLPDETIATLDNYEMPWGKTPFYPNRATTHTGNFIHERKIGRSDRCESCHSQLTREWRSSMHGRSASDPAFQSNLQAVIKGFGAPTTRYCFGCHGPVVLLSGQARSGRTLDGGTSINEGVSCMACHGVKQITDLKGSGSYLFGPTQDYLFAYSDNPILRSLHDYLIDINPKLHLAEMAPTLTGSPKSCAACHEQYIDKELNNWSWVQLQRQYTSWLNGPFSKQSKQTFSHLEQKRCQDCHFPLVPSDDPSANSSGQVRTHRSPAANTAIPYLLGDKVQLETVKQFMQDDRLRLSISTPMRHTPKAGGKANLMVTVTSRQIGHFFPAGTIDINQPWIELVVSDADGNTIYSDGLVDDHGVVDPNARFYYSVLVNRDGAHVWKHDLLNAVGETHLNLIKPGESDMQQYSFPIPKETTGPLKVAARLRYRKFNQKYATWALGKKGKDLPIVDMASGELIVPLDSQL
ncbi:MAG: hypothetical protein GY808_19225 [Gammaproteobacteria bacterium]|nr:hypothetical protein [Gammaproteobacteria bacterium]